MNHRGRVVHHLPGRIRIHFPKAKGNQLLLERIEKAISPIPGVRSVLTNPLTGSVLVLYDAGTIEDFESRVGEQAGEEKLDIEHPPALTEVDELERKIEAEAEFLAAHSDTAREALQFLGRLNRRLLNSTGGAVDLKVLIPLVAALFGLIKGKSSAGTPFWFSLMVFSFNSFVALHHPAHALAGGPVRHELVFEDPETRKLLTKLLEQQAQQQKPN